MFEWLWSWTQAESKTPPVVGISGGNADSASVRAMMTQISSTGAIPLFLGNHANRNAAADIEKIDALVVMGNNKDVRAPGIESHPGFRPEDDTPEGKARADYEYELLRLAIAQKMPTLGVCGGEQRINVMLGGSLEYVADKTGNHDHAQQERNIAPFTPVQVVHIEDGTTLSEISRSVNAVYTPAHGVRSVSDVAENSMHSWAVERVGQGLRVSAVSNEPDKNGNPTQVIEAIEADPNGPLGGQFILGVQWHPEFSASHLGTFIASRIAEEGSKYAKEHGRVHPMSQAVEENKFSMMPMMKDSPAPMAIGSMTARLAAQRNAGRSTQLSV